MNVKIHSFDDVYDTDVLLDDVNMIYVSVVSGDEIMNVYLNNGESVHLDASDFSNCERQMSFFNGSYVVLNDDLQNWNNRTDSYDWAQHASAVIGSF